MRMTQKNKIIILGGLGILALFIFVTQTTSSSPKIDHPYADFAQCINDSDALFYGAYWCSACNAQKEMFGESASLLPYVECSLSNGSQNLGCKKKEIETYPTWEFADGSRTVGRLSFERLAEKTGCSLPDITTP